VPDDGSVFWCGQRRRLALSAPHSYQAMSAFKLSLALSAVLVATAAAQTTVDDVVAKNLAAKGGIEKLRAITTVKMTGSLKSPSGVTAITTWAKRPTFMRRDNVNDGQTFVTAFDGKTLWQINPLISPRPREIPAPPEAEDFDSLLLDYKEKGRTVELVVTEPVQGINMHRLRVTEKNGQIRDIYINAETMLESKAVVQVEQGARKAIVTTEFSNYKTIDGISVPMHVRQMLNGKPLTEVTYDRVEFNVPIPDSMFSKPVQ
jgi:outer membrane lipoprotein-sorting protein